MTNNSNNVNTDNERANCYANPFWDLLAEQRKHVIINQINNLISHYELLFDAEPLNNLDEADELIYFYLQPEPRMQHRWILTLKNNNVKIGTCGFHCWDKNKNCVDIGYDLQVEYWSQGLMSEALNAILDFAQNEMKIKQVHAHIYVDNL
jgi:ribosomal-protein-alanine N-acetyltransferase